MLGLRGSWRRNLSIKWKIALVTAFSCALALILAFEILIVWDLTVFERSLNKDVTSLAQAVASTSIQALEAGDEAQANRTLSGLRARSEITAAALYDASGKIIGRYVRAGGQRASIPSRPMPNSSALADGKLEVFQGVRDKGNSIGYVYLCADTSLWGERISTYTLIVLGVLIGSVLFAFGLAWLLQRTISGPIVTLAHTMRRVSAMKNYSLRAEKPSNDEIGSLVDGFNSMLSEIQQRDAALQSVNDELEERVRKRTKQLEAEITERKRAEEEITARNRDLLTLHKISQLGLVAAPLQDAFQSIVSEIAEATGFPIVFVESYDQRRQVMVYQNGIGMSPQMRSKFSETPADESLSGVVARSGSPLVLLAKDLKGGGGSEFLASAGINAFICMPMFASEGVTGTISLAHRDSIEPDSRLLRWLESLSNFLGLLLERQRSDQILREAEERTRNIIESALDAVVTIGEDGRITGWNGQAEMIFGWKRDEVLGNVVHETIIPERYRQAHLAGMQRFLESADRQDINRRFEFSALNKTGHEFPIELSISTTETASGVTFNAFIRDITERKQVEAETRQARDAALEAAKLKSEFLANMSHEIRTPMNGVIGMTDLLMDTKLSDDQKDYAITIKNSAEALLTIINDILDFSKIEAGKMSIDLSETNLREVLEEVADLLASVAHAKGVELLCSVRPNVPELIKADSVRIRQIVNNLLGNAVKFTDTGEVVMLCETVSETDTHATVRISVKDTGIGIPQDRVRTIFDSFTQVDGSTTRRFGGTGLGLTICRQLVNLMGGEIGVSSKVGVGSTFWVELEFEKLADPRKTVALPEDIMGLRALVVDDNSTNRFILNELLTMWGCEVAEVESGAAAVETLRSNEFQVVILDMQMPNMDGLQTAKAISQLKNGQMPKMILLSSVGEIWPKDELESSGIGCCLSKPVRQAQLYGAIFEAMGLRLDGPRRRAGERDALKPSDVPLRILLAEDNVVNRKVATKLLHRLGHEVVTAENGAAAVKLAIAEDFDLVLMDVQMPEMDGLEATAAIRQFEMDGNTRTPIVAMTAHVMKGDRERCIAAGMDDYVSKPITPDKIKKVLRAWARPHLENEADDRDSPTASGAVDNDYLQEVTSGDVLFAAELVEDFKSDSAELLMALKIAAKEGSAPDLQKAAHSLKGCSSSIGARELASACEEIESLARTSGIMEASELIRQVDFKLAEAIAWLDAKMRKTA